MYVHLSKYEGLKKSIWDEKYLQLITDVINDILHKYNQKEDYIQDVLNLRELMNECNHKLIKYYIGDKDDKHYIRLIDSSVTDDMRYLLFTVYNDILLNNPLYNVPNIIILEYCIFREGYIKNNIIDEDYGLDINEKQYVYDILLPHPTEDDLSRYVLEKHFSHIQYQVMEYMGDETQSQVLINSIYDYQKELIEMCRTELSVEDTKHYTHPSYEFSLLLLPSVAKQIVPLFSELLGINLLPSSTLYPSYSL